MIPRRTFVAAAFLLLSSLPAAAQESGGFVVRLGRDTTSIETYARTGGRLVVQQVGRAPRVLTRRYEYESNAAGVPQRASAVITSPTAAKDAPPIQSIAVTLAADSLTMESRRDTIVQRARVVNPAGLVVTAGASPWSVYDLLSMRAAAGTADSLRVPTYSVGGNSIGRVTIHKLAADSIAIETDNDRYHAQVDRAGRILHVIPVRGTVRVSVDRADGLDLAALTASFAAREQAGGGLGALSTRDTTRASAGDATLWIDYGRPAKRGRNIFGEVVPWGEVWRTGANAATQFRTDKALEMGGVVVPAGLYTLFSIPGPRGWKLIINSETGITGTARKAEKDLFTLDMKVEALQETVERFTIRVEPSAQGGTLQLDWDTTRASIPFIVKP